MCQTMSATRKKKDEVRFISQNLVKLSKQGIKTLALHTLEDPLANLGYLKFLKKSEDIILKHQFVLMVFARQAH